LLSRSAAFTTLAGRNGPDGSWRDHSSNLIMFCASAGLDARIAEEAPARAAISSVTVASLQCLIVVSLIPDTFTTISSMPVTIAVSAGERVARSPADQCIHTKRTPHDHGLQLSDA
jgi:hypothetical protein